MLIEAHPTILCQLFRCPFNYCFVFLALLLCSRRWRFRSLCSLPGCKNQMQLWLDLLCSSVDNEYTLSRRNFLMIHYQESWLLEYSCSKAVLWRLHLLKFAQWSKQRLGRGFQYPRQAWVYIRNKIDEHLQKSMLWWPKDPTSLMHIVPIRRRKESILSLWNWEVRIDAIFLACARSSVLPPFTTKLVTKAQISFTDT